MGDKASGVLVLISAALLCAVLGSIHAFSVFLDPLQQAFGLSRATVSLTYSFGLLAITLAVLLGPRFYSITTPARLFAIVGLLGAFGAVLAGIAGGIAGIWVGYSLCFGIANGMGYGFALQYAARANPSRPGLAMGTVTAAYALGAALAPLLFVKALAAGGFGAAMTVLAAALLLAAGGAAMAVARSGIPYGERTEATTITLPPAPAIIRIWLAYGTGVAAGLMAIGHAAGFAALAGIAPWLAPAVLALCNMAGSLTGGYLADRALRLAGAFHRGPADAGAGPGADAVGTRYSGFCLWRHNRRLSRSDRPPVSRRGGPGGLWPGLYRLGAGGASGTLDRGAAL